MEEGYAERPPAHAITHELIDMNRKREGEISNVKEDEKRLGRGRCEEEEGDADISRFSRNRIKYSFQCSYYRSQDSSAIAHGI
jgi:hypothetical protein